MTIKTWGSPLLCTGVAVALGFGLAQWPKALAAEAHARPTLDMGKQLSLEKLELRIFAMPQVQQQLAIGEDLYRHNHLSQTPDGSATLKNAVRAITLSTIQDAILDDPSRPQIMWVSNAPHSWSGVSVPGSGYGIDNPDNLYRYVAVDGDSRYEISGKRTGLGPAQESFVLYSAIPGSGGKNVEGAPIIGAISNKDIDFGRDGSFKIVIDGDAAATGKNHLLAKPGAKLLIIRDTLADWTNQFPNRLSVRRIAGPPAPPQPSEAEIADRSVALAKTVVPFWLDYFDQNTYAKLPNYIPAPFARGGGWGFASGGWYKLQDDEALVVTLKSLGAQYLGFQVTDPWGVAPDYIHHTSSLNASQAKANQDGSLTYVMAATDPGAWNWLNTEGMHTGLFTVRWQGLPDGVTSAGSAILSIKIMKISDLKQKLVPETKWVTPAERQKQEADRAASYALRLAN